LPNLDTNSRALDQSRKVERTDEQLARDAAAGNTEAFGVLVDRLRAPLVAYLVGLVGGRDDAEEAAQEALLIAWERLRSLRNPARVSAWIHGIARNLAMKQAGALRPVPLADGPPPAGDCEQEQGEQDERSASLMAAVSRLSEPHREVILRKHFGGLGGDEIARQLGVAPGTVRSRLSRAYAELRGMLVEQEDDG
jgi:RNA polymerase sigma-70 factor (ECF subfamily)